MSCPAKVMVIGLDSADYKLVSEWCDSGDLPVLQSLKEKGVHGRLMSPAGMGDDATWASFYTAVSPARHGRYFVKAIQHGSYETPFFCDADLQHEPFWNVLSRAGRKIAVIDVPKCPSATALNGIHLTDWHVHGRDHATRSWPPEIAPDLLARYGDDRTDRWDADWLCRLDSLSTDEIETLIHRLLESIDHKLSAAETFLAHGDWDLFLIVFKESHCVGHGCWHLLDKSHPAYSAEQALRFGHPIKRIYQAIDRAIAKLLEQAGSGCHVIVFSDLGMGPNYTGEHLLDAVLLRLEDSLTWPLRQRIAMAAERIKWKVRARPLDEGASVHPHRSRRAFQLEHNEMSGAIRLNIIGREAEGRIPPGYAVENFCRLLTGELLKLVNSETGHPIVDSVLRTKALFKGDHVDALPDLFVVWNRHCPIAAAVSPTIGEIRIAPPAYRTGNHLPGGFYLSCGPGITKAAQLPPASIMDIGPTIAAWLETSLYNLDGKPISALCGSPRLSN